MKRSMAIREKMNKWKHARNAKAKLMMHGEREAEEVYGSAEGMVMIGMDGEYHEDDCDDEANGELTRKPRERK